MHNTVGAENVHILLHGQCGGTAERAPCRWAGRRGRAVLGEVNICITVLYSSILYCSVLYIHAYIVLCFNESDVFIICVRNSSRRIPHTQTFDLADPLHTAFVETLASLRRRVLGGGGSSGSSSSGNSSNGSSTVEDNLLNPVNHTLESHSSHTFERENLTEAIIQSVAHSAGSVEYWQLQQWRAQPEDFEKVGTVIYIYTLCCYTTVYHIYIYKVQ